MGIAISLVMDCDVATHPFINELFLTVFGYNRPELFGRDFNRNGKLDFSYFKHLHFYIFQDIYGWAGKTRTVNISKGSPFCLCQFIDDQAIELFQKLERENYLVDAENIAERLSFYLSELNAIHPFREGNGRAQRMFIEILADRAGYEVDFSEVTAEEMIEASYQSFNQNYDPMNAIMRRITIPKE